MSAACWFCLMQFFTLFAFLFDISPVMPGKRQGPHLSSEALENPVPTYSPNLRSAPVLAVNPPPPPATPSPQAAAGRVGSVLLRGINLECRWPYENGGCLANRVTVAGSVYAMPVDGT